MNVPTLSVGAWMRKDSRNVAVECRGKTTTSERKDGDTKETR